MFIEDQFPTISRAVKIFTHVGFFFCDEISGRTSGNKQKAAANLVPCDFAPLQVWRWCNRIKWAACMQIIYAARQSNSESQARYRVHVPKEALHFPLSVPRIWIYSSESRANNRLSAQVYLSSCCCCWCGGCVPKIVPAPISEHVLFKFNEKEAARLCDKFRIRWRGRDEAIFALERKRLLIHATFCSPPLFVWAGAHRKRETARRAKLCDRAQRAALLQLIPPVYILFCFRKVGRRTNHANCCSFCLRSLSHSPGWNLAWIHGRDFCKVSNWCYTDMPSLALYWPGFVWAASGPTIN
jgi:hypothetical protein